MSENLNRAPAENLISAEVPSVPDADWNLQLGGEELNVYVTGFTEGKDPNPAKNEDKAGYNETCFVIADGSTPKQGNAREIDGLSGGRIAADVVVAAVLGSQADGRELVDAVTASMRDYYSVNYPDALDDPQLSFATTFVAARIVEGEEGPGGTDGPMLRVTQVGDTAFRLNGTEMITERRMKDEIDAADRAVEIKRQLELGVPEAEAVKLGRKAIEPSLNEQYKLWNNPDAEHGFGYVNGHFIPDQFIHTYEFPLSGVRTLEIVSDGYPEKATEPTVAAWEQAYQHVVTTDPQRYNEYPATKPNDDRTVLIATFDKAN